MDCLQRGYFENVSKNRKNDLNIEHLQLNGSSNQPWQWENLSCSNICLFCDLMVPEIEFDHLYLNYHLRTCIDVFYNWYNIGSLFCSTVVAFKDKKAVIMAHRWDLRIMQSQFVQSELKDLVFTNPVVNNKRYLQDK